MYVAYSQHVERREWDGRYAWLRETEEEVAGEWGSILLSPQGTLLSYDVEAAFCAGAWLSVIIVAHAAIDATIRDTELGDYKSNFKKIAEANVDLEWLRTLRNRLVHVAEPEVAFVREDRLDDIAAFHETFEPDARRAVRLLFQAIYAIRGT